MTMRFDDTALDHMHADDDELVRRLRSLEWPGVTPEFKQRCWADFQRRMEDPTAAATEMRQEAEAQVARRNVERRQSFTRTRLPGRDRLGVRLASYATPRWSWDRREAPRLASLAG